MTTVLSEELRAFARTCELSRTTIPLTSRELTAMAKAMREAAKILESNEVKS